MAFRTSYRPGIGFFGAIYLVAGIVVALDRDYLTLNLLRRIGSALLAVLLWFLVLLGIDLRIH